MRQKLIHLLGGGPWQVPTARLARSMGYRVLVTHCFADRPAYAYADHHEVVDITDREATLAVASRYRVDGILCDTTDVGVPTAAYVAGRLGLPGIGHEVSLNFTNKGRMRTLALHAGLNVPPFRLLRDAAELDRCLDALPLPVAVKPVDSQSGKGVTLVDSRPGLLPAFLHALRHSREGCVLVEAVVPGVEIIVDGFMLAGRARILGIAVKTPDPRQPTVSARITYGADLPPERIGRIVEVNQRTLAALGLVAGVFHAEYMLAADDVVPIDIAARGGGCMIYTHVIPHVSGVDANRAMIALAAGESVAVDPTRRRGANIEFFRIPEGVVAALDGMDECVRQADVLGLHCGISVGDRVGPLRAKDDRPGYIVAGGNSAAAALAAALAAKTCVRVRMEGETRSLPVD